MTTWAERIELVTSISWTPATHLVTPLKTFLAMAIMEGPSSSSSSSSFVAKLTLKDNASDEDVQQLIDLVNVVTDEITSADPSRLPSRFNSRRSSKMAAA